MEALDRAIKAMGGTRQLALAVGVASSLPSMWKKRGNVPAEHCPAIERETRRRSKPVLCEELNPGVDWQVLRAPQ